jgi:hypothetical protein
MQGMPEDLDMNLHRFKLTYSHYTVLCDLRKLKHLYLRVLILWRRVILKKLTVAQLVNKFAAFHGNRRFSALQRQLVLGPYTEAVELSPLSH